MTNIKFNNAQWLVSVPGAMKPAVSTPERPLAAAHTPYTVDYLDRHGIWADGYSVYAGSGNANDARIEYYRTQLLEVLPDQTYLIKDLTNDKLVPFANLPDVVDRLNAIEDPSVDDGLRWLNRNDDPSADARRWINRDVDPRDSLFQRLSRIKDRSNDFRPSFPENRQSFEASFTGPKRDEFRPNHEPFFTKPSGDEFISMLERLKAQGQPMNRDVDHGFVDDPLFDPAHGPQAIGLKGTDHVGPFTQFRETRSVQEVLLDYFEGMPLATAAGIVAFLQSDGMSAIEFNGQDLVRKFVDYFNEDGFLQPKNNPIELFLFQNVSYNKLPKNLLFWTAFEEVLQEGGVTTAEQALAFFNIMPRSENDETSGYKIDSPAHVSMVVDGLAQHAHAQGIHRTPDGAQMDVVVAAIKSLMAEVDVHADLLEGFDPVVIFEALGLFVGYSRAIDFICEELGITEEHEAAFAAVLDGESMSEQDHDDQEDDLRRISRALLMDGIKKQMTKNQSGFNSY